MRIAIIRRVQRAVGVAAVSAALLGSGLAVGGTATGAPEDTGLRDVLKAEGSIPIPLSGINSVRDAQKLGADEAIATFDLPSGMQVTVGASLGEKESPDSLARKALEELAASLDTLAMAPAAFGINAEPGVRMLAVNPDVAALAAIVNGNVPVQFSEVRNSSIVAKKAKEFTVGNQRLLSDTSSSAVDSPVVAAAVSASSNWYPAVMQASSYANSSGRVGKLAFYWTAAAKENLVNFSSRVTFEPDFNTNNKDGKHYFGNSIKSWSTTMPSGYKDTNAFDNPEIRTYTIGTSDANAIKSGVTYQTVFITGVGNATSDTGNANAQLGKHLAGCQSTWCIFGEKSRKFFRSPSTFSMRIPSGTWQPSPASQSTW